MVQSAMSVVSSSGLVPVDGEPGGLREAVIAGPGGPVDAGPVLLGRVWQVVADQAVIDRALTGAGHRDRRRRVLTGLVTVLAVLGLCLFRRESAAVVLGRVSVGVPRVRVEGVPSGTALSKGRARLAAGVMEQVFTCAARLQPATGERCYAFGLLVTAFDGTVFDLADTVQMRAEFATPSGGSYPQARMVALVVCGTRWVAAAEVGSAARSEQALADELIGALRPGMLNLADRGFFSMHRWIRAAATGAQLAWRVKNGARSLPAKIIGVLPDSSALVRLHESDAMLARRRATAGDRSLARLDDNVARLVEFTVTSRDRAGRTRTSRFRILTTLCDHEQYPATTIAALYAERWQIELVYARIKTTLRGPGTRLRGQTPHLALQEIWGLLTVYNALVRLAVAAAVDLGVDPDAISFATVLALTRNHLNPPTTCPGCGHTSDTDPAALVTAIAGQPLNRHDRQRTGPRTSKQRLTERTRDVTYEITIVPPNLPIEDR